MELTSMLFSVSLVGAEDFMPDARLEQWIEGSYVPPVGAYFHVGDDAFDVAAIHIYANTSPDAIERSRPNGFTEVVLRDRPYRGSLYKGLIQQGWRECSEYP